MDLLPGLFRDAASVGLVAQNGGGGAGSGSTSTTSSGEVKDSESRSVWTGVLDARCVSSVVDIGWRIHTVECAPGSAHRDIFSTCGNTKEQDQFADHVSLRWKITGRMWKP